MPSQEELSRVLQHESGTTLRVLRAYPESKLDLRPAEKSRTARELAWTFVGELGVLQSAITKGAVDFSDEPPAPKTLAEIISTYEKLLNEVKQLVANLSDADFEKTVKFPVGPGQMGDVDILNLAWITLMDQVHHRGQLTVYLRMAGGKVPSIYGPTADEPWD
ncbi:MAG: DinB family protein [Parcubacteria group bacterium]|nr:DinB family protein [Parcubacteria group bacterium]